VCGIGGYFSRAPIPEDQGRAILELMARALHHRGPDDRGFLVTPHCGLLATRLSIIDVQGGHMPLFNEDGQVAVTFNGEIYNHASLRDALIAKGHAFRTRSDTEVLVHGYEDRGEDLCRDLVGMFAFAIWDERRGRLFLARDRFGIKPLLMTEVRGLHLFASEAKAIFATERSPRRLDPRALLDTMTAGYPMPARTMFSGISALSPASHRVLEVDGADRTQRYWSLGAGTSLVGVDAAAQDLKHTLEATVSDHLIADVPVGSYLSGGIDSITIATLAARKVEQPLSTFSMGFSSLDAAYDETMIADLVARAIGSRHTRLEITRITADDYEGTITAMEAPQVHTVAFCLFQLSRAVRESGLKVVLTGEGSDEIFAGYGAFRLRRMRRWFGGWFRPIRDVLMSMLALITRSDVIRSMVRWSRYEDAVRSRYGLLPPWLEQWWLLLDECAQILTPGARERLMGRAKPWEVLPEPITRERGVGSMLQQELEFERASRLDGWVLALGDRLTMAHSVEARVPFLDHRVAEIAAAAPDRFLIRGLEEKYLLRQAMQGVLVEAARTRKKRAFMAPIVRWLFADPRPSFVDETFSASALERNRLFDHHAVQESLRYVASGRRDLRALRASWALNLALGIETLTRHFGASLD
jgi:asparagine synthase (glutamine-hydrolysing)